MLDAEQRCCCTLRKAPPERLRTTQNVGITSITVQDSPLATRSAADRRPYRDVRIGKSRRKGPSFRVVYDPEVCAMLVHSPISATHRKNRLDQYKNAPAEAGALVANVRVLILALSQRESTTRNQGEIWHLTSCPGKLSGQMLLYSL